MNSKTNLIKWIATSAVFLSSVTASACFWQRAKEGNNIYECVTSYKDISLLRSDLFSSVSKSKNLEAEMLRIWNERASEITTVSQNILIGELENMFYNGAPTLLLPEGISLEEIRKSNSELGNTRDLIKDVNKSVEETLRADPQLSGEGAFASMMPAGIMVGATFAIDKNTLDAIQNLKGIQLGYTAVLRSFSSGSIFMGVIVVPQVIVAKAQILTDPKTGKLIHKQMLPVRRNQFGVGTTSLAERFTWDYRVFFNPTLDATYFGAERPDGNTTRKKKGLKFTWGAVWGRDIWAARQIGGFGGSLSVPLETVEKLGNTILSQGEVPNLPGDINKKLFGFLKGRGKSMIDALAKTDVDTVKFAVTTTMDIDEINSGAPVRFDNYFVNIRHVGKTMSTAAAKPQTRGGVYFFVPQAIPQWIAGFFGASQAASQALSSGDYLNSFTGALTDYLNSDEPNPNASSVPLDDISNEELETQASKVEGLLKALEKEGQRRELGTSEVTEVEPSEVSKDDDTAASETLVSPELVGSPVTLSGAGK